ncbi:MAG: hypothetical protein ACJ77K_01505 [Bacteroidia bacterium]
MTPQQNSYIIKCPWCKSEFPNSGLTNCPNCGGNVEYQLDRRSLGSKPLPAPRELPKKFVKRIKYTSNVMTILGIVFTIPFFWTIVFPVIGIFLWKKGIKTANDELIPLEHGAVTTGEITAVRQDFSKVINNQSPFIVEFTFEANGQKYAGDVGNIFDRNDAQKQVGDQLWVVYMPEDPSLSSIWPPLS